MDGQKHVVQKAFYFLPLHLSAQTRSLSAPVIYRTTMTLELRFKVRLFSLRAIFDFRFENDRGHRCRRSPRF
jgi:hypothetical protein